MDPCSTALQAATGNLLGLFDDVDVSGLDVRVQTVTRRLGAMLFEQALRRRGEAAEERARQAGGRVHRRPSLVVKSLFGPVALPSPYLRWPSGGGVSPLARDLGLHDGWRSPALDKALADFGSEVSFERAAAQFAAHYGWNPKRALVRRATHAAGAQALGFVEQRLRSAPAEQSEVATMVAQMDGSMVRTGKLEALKPVTPTARRGIAKSVRHTEWREVRVGLVRPLESEHPTYVARLGPYPEVVEQMRGAARLRGLGEATVVHAVGDGGNGLREAMKRGFPTLSFTLDWPHLAGHFHETAEAMGLGEDARKKWVEHRMELVAQGRHAEVAAELGGRRGKGQVRARRLAGHLTHHGDALGYAKKKEAGLPIGSGEVESSHRSLVQARLKLPGAWWAEESINGMLALRVLRANAWWMEFWASRAPASLSLPHPISRAELSNAA